MSKMTRELERKLWKAADALRGNISSENYMHIVIGIMFLKHMSDNFDTKIVDYETKEGQKIDRNDKDDLALANVSFIIPKEAEWNYIANYASQPSIGLKLDEAFEKIEKANPLLIGLFDKNYNREELDQGRLGMVVSEFSNVNLKEMGEDVIGRTYEFFLGEFFKKQGQKGGEFYTPKCIVDLMVQIINPTKGKICDPAAGTGGMLVQARNHIIEQGNNPDLLVPYGQEFQNKTWKLSKINLLLHGFHAESMHLGAKSADSFTEDQHKGERFDYVLANPPFNVKKWGLEQLSDDDPRWEWGTPPQNNANYAWLSHMIHKLNYNGRGATVLANGSLSSSGKRELAIRNRFIETGVIEAIITLPDKMFYTTGIPACIWVFKKQRTNRNVLMIDASNFAGEMKSKKLRELTSQEIKKIVNIYNKYINNEDVEEVGFAKSVNGDEIKANDYSFVPGRYVGFVEEEIDKEAIKKELQESSQELKKLIKEFQDLLPKVEESIEKAINFKEK